MSKKPFVTLEQVKEIVKTYPTPFHIYDERGIRENVKKLKEAFAWNKGFREYFAVKATPNPFLINILKEYGCGVDCASETELMMAEAMGFSGDGIMFSSNATPAREYEYARKLNAQINLDDFTHVEFLDKVCGIPETICCRFNPGGYFQIANSIMDNPGDAKYGMTKDQIIEAYKILKEYKISQGEGTYLVVSGFEDVQEVTVNDINATYQIYGSVETQDTVQNMLFLANVDKPKTQYDDLADCALRFLPILSVSEKYNTKQIGLDYTGSISNTYYDPYYIYNKVGYWDDEMYRFGVVFIKSDNTLTEVFNVRGRKNLSENISESDYSKTEFMKDGQRTYINYQDTNYRIVQTNGTVSEENAKGVVDIQHSGFSTIIGINFILPKEVLDYLKSTLKIKGFFFVRQKRIPTTLCQAYTIGIDKQSHTPVLPVNLDGTSTYIAEGFLSKGEQVQKKNPFGV